MIEAFKNFYFYYLVAVLRFEKISSHLNAGSSIGRVGGMRIQVYIYDDIIM